MTIVREINNSDTILSYLASLALFCGISCTILMLRFGGFKASLNLSSGKRCAKEKYDLAPQVSVSGAYRISRDEYFGNNNYLESRNKSQSVVKVPSQTRQTIVPANIKPSKSTGDVSKINTASEELRKSTPNVAVSIPLASNKQTKQQIKEQKKIEKERVAEMKKREKLAAQERAKQEKLRKEREKLAAQQQAKETKEKQRKKKPTAPQPQQTITSKQSNIPQPPPFQTMGPTLQPNANPLSRYSTNTLESSISRNTGPPPYDESSDVVPTRDEKENNIRYGQPIEATSSWDMISQHRQQINRKTTIASNNTKQKHLDLHYNAGNSSNNEDRDNSEA